jgi:hypothetical protein
MGTDFAVAEECSRYDECGEYVSAYGAHVLMIEYSDEDFAAGCAAYGASHPVVHRDLDLVYARRRGLRARRLLSSQAGRLTLHEHRIGRYCAMRSSSTSYTSMPFGAPSRPA